MGTTRNRTPWTEVYIAGTARRILRNRGYAGSVDEIAGITSWSRGKIRARLQIHDRVTWEVIHLASVSDRQMSQLPLARLLDVARAQTVEQRAIVLSYAAHGRRPGWADGGADA